MKKLTKIIRIVLTLVMCLTLCSQMTFAADVTVDGGEGTTPVVLDVDAAAFSVNVPTVLPITVTADGDVQVADSAKIINNSAGAVAVVNVAIESKNDWALVSFDTDPLTFKVNEKKIGLQLNSANEKTTDSESFAFDATKWGVMTATDGADSGEDEYVFTYDAIVAPQASAVTDTTVASIVFTIDWDKGDVVTTPTVYYNQPYNSTVDGNAVTVVAYEDGSAEYFQNGISSQTWPAGSITLEGTTLSIGETLTGELSADGTVVTVGSVTYTLNIEEHDIYFGEEYSVTVDGNTTTYVLYEDGSGTVGTTTMPAGGVTYGDRTIVDSESGETIFYVSLDGTQLIGPGEVIITYTPTEAETTIEPGLYETGSNYTVLKTSWFDLLANDVVHVDNGVVYTNVDIETGVNGSSNALAGDLLLPTDGSVTTLGDFDINTVSGNVAFNACVELTGIVIPDSVTTISDGAFGYCTSLTNIDIPATVTNIGTCAFQHCASLTSVTIGEGVTSIGVTAFADCVSLESVTFAETSQLATINFNAFFNCTGLTNIKIPDSVTTIGEQAFSDCANLQSVTFGENSQLTTIGQSAFCGCTSLESIEIPASVTTIALQAFWGCTGLTNIKIPDNVTTIGERAFYNCTGLTSIEIPATVTTIASQAFECCTSLTNVYYTGTAEQWAALVANIGTFNEPLTNATIHYNYTGE